MQHLGWMKEKFFKADALKGKHGRFELETRLSQHSGASVPKCHTACFRIDYCTMCTVALNYDTRLGIIGIGLYEGIFLVQVKSLFWIT